MMKEAGKSGKGMYPYTVTIITGNGETARVSGPDDHFVRFTQY